MAQRQQQLARMAPGFENDFQPQQQYTAQQIQGLNQIQGSKFQPSEAYNLKRIGGPNLDDSGKKMTSLYTGSNQRKYVPITPEVAEFLNNIVASTGQNNASIFLSGNDGSYSPLTSSAENGSGFLSGGVPFKADANASIALPQREQGGNLVIDRNGVLIPGSQQFFQNLATSGIPIGVVNVKSKNTGRRSGQLGLGTNSWWKQIQDLLDNPSAVNEQYLQDMIDQGFRYGLATPLFQFAGITGQGGQYNLDPLRNKSNFKRAARLSKNWQSNFLANPEKKRTGHLGAVMNMAQHAEHLSQDKYSSYDPANRNANINTVNDLLFNPDGSVKLESVRGKLSWDQQSKRANAPSRRSVFGPISSTDGSALQNLTSADPYGASCGPLQSPDGVLRFNQTQRLRQTADGGLSSSVRCDSNSRGGVDLTRSSMINRPVQGQANIHVPLGVGQSVYEYMNTPDNLSSNAASGIGRGGDDTIRILGRQYANTYGTVWQGIIDAIQVQINDNPSLNNAQLSAQQLQQWLGTSPVPEYRQLANNIGLIQDQVAVLNRIRQALQQNGSPSDIQSTLEAALGNKFGLWKLGTQYINPVTGVSTTRERSDLADARLANQFISGQPISPQGHLTSYQNVFANQPIPGASIRGAGIGGLSGQQSRVTSRQGSQFPTQSQFPASSGFEPLKPQAGLGPSVPGSQFPVEGQFGTAGF